MSNSQLHLATLHQLPSLTYTAWSAIVQAHLFEQRLDDWNVADLVALRIEPDRARRLVQERALLRIERLQQRLQQFAVQVLSIHDRAYPQILRQIPKPPPVLYVRGNLAVIQIPGLAVVGTRRATPYGLTVTERLLEPVTRTGLPIVSGLAAGIDAAAHRVAVRRGSPTIAVFGTGIDVIYPWSNHQLASEILQRGGALVSEFPLGAGPERFHFPQRNRIISGLSRAVLLVEAGEKSGALITAKYALDQNREVLAVPGSIVSDQSSGVNSWLRLGAKPVLTAQDIFEVFALDSDPAPGLAAPPPSDPDQAAILACLSQHPVHIDELVKKSRLDTSRVSASLVLMEINGSVRHHGGMYYSLNSA